MTVPVVSELENQLVEAGNRLLNPPSPADELLSLLDEVETHLSNVDQLPSESMQTALDPLKKALVANDLLNHSDMDVKVATASCISEVTRITAPNAPYGDDQMKDIFQLIVSTFENLFDMSSPSFPRRVSILETVAKVRSCVVMLDLECDGLIYAMFQHFLKAIRDDHPENVVTSIETIMTLVLEESEDISSELISLLLTYVKKDNEDVLPAARKLGERILQNCAVKVKPYLMQAVLSMGHCMDDYDKIVATVCQEASGTVDQSTVSGSEEEMADGEKLLETTGSDETPQVVDSLPRSISRESEVGVDMSQTSLTSNGSAEDGDDGLQKSPDTANNKSEQSHCPHSMKTDIDSSVGKIVTSKSKQDLPTKKTGGKTNSANAGNVLMYSHGETDKEAVELPDHSKGQLEKGNTKQDASVGIALSSEQVGDEVPTSADSISKQQNQPDKKEGAWENKYDTQPSTKVISEKSSGEVNNLEEKPMKKSGKKKITDNDKQPANKEESKIKSVGGKSAEKKNVTGESAGKKKVSSVDETPKTNSKRKRGSETKETSGKREPKKEYGEELVGTKIEVWWPRDKQFYGGVIDSFDPVKKTHKVFYFDGDVEILSLKRERWVVIEGDGTSGDDQESDQASLVSSAMVKGSSTSKGKSKDDASRSGGNSKLGKSKVEISDKSKTEDEKSGESDDDQLISKNVQRSVVNLKDSISKFKGDGGVSGSKPSVNYDVNSKGKSSAVKAQGSGEKVEKGKADSVKSGGTGTKSGKKRQRGFKG